MSGILCLNQVSSEPQTIISTYKKSVVYKLWIALSKITDQQCVNDGSENSENPPDDSQGQYWAHLKEYFTVIIVNPKYKKLIYCINFM